MLAVAQPFIQNSFGASYAPSLMHISRRTRYLADQKGASGAIIAVAALLYSAGKGPGGWMRRIQSTQTWKATDFAFRDHLNYMISLYSKKI